MRDPEQALGCIVAATICWWRRTATGTASPPCCCKISDRFIPARTVIKTPGTLRAGAAIADGGISASGIPTSVPCSAILASCIAAWATTRAPLEMARRGLEVDTAVSGPDHPDVGIALLNLARITTSWAISGWRSNRVDRAIEIFNRRFPPGASTAHSCRQFQGGISDRARTARRSAEHAREFGCRGSRQRRIEARSSQWAGDSCGHRAPGQAAARRRKNSREACWPILQSAATAVSKRMHAGPTHTHWQCRQRWRKPRPSAHSAVA